MGFAWGLLGVCLGCDEPMLGDVRFTMFAWGFDTFLLGDEFFERCAWGCGFQGLVCLGTSISAPLLLGDLLGVDLLGSVRQGCNELHHVFSMFIKNNLRTKLRT